MTSEDDALTATSPIWRVNYTSTSATNAFRNVPRFGHSNDISLLFSDEEDECADYTMGVLLFMETLTLTCFLTWGILLLVFKYLGRTRVGILSGSPFLRPANGAGSEDNKQERRLYQSRLIFLISAIVFVLFTFLLVTNGIGNLQTTLSTVENANRNSDELLANFDALASSLSQWLQRAESIRIQAIKNLNEFCPDASSSQHDQDNSDHYNDIQRQIQEAKDYLVGDFQDFSEDSEIKDIQDAVVQARTITSSVDEDLSHLLDLSNGWQVMCVVILLLLIVSSLISGLLLTWLGVGNVIYQRYYLSWFILPMMVIVVVIASTGVVGASAAAIVNADFCSGGDKGTPDETILSILAYSGMHKEENVAIESARYYLSQCSTTEQDPFEFVRDSEQQVRDAGHSLQNLEVSLENVTVARLYLLCDTDLTPTNALLSSMDEVIDALQEHLTSVLDSIACHRIVPLYTRTVYSGTCDYSIKGLAWIVSSLFLLAVSGMWMLTFRSVLWEIDTQETTIQLEKAVEECKVFPNKEEEDSQDGTVDAPFSSNELFVATSSSQHDDDEVNSDSTSGECEPSGEMGAPSCEDDNSTRGECDPEALVPSGEMGAPMTV